MGTLDVPGVPDESVTHENILATVERLGFGEVKSMRITVYPKGTDPVSAEIDADKLKIQMGSLDPILRVDAKITSGRQTVIEVLKIHRNGGANGKAGIH